MKKSTNKPKAKTAAKSAAAKAAAGNTAAAPKPDPRPAKTIAFSHDPLRGLLRGTHASKTCR